MSYGCDEVWGEGMSQRAHVKASLPPRDQPHDRTGRCKRERERERRREEEGQAAPFIVGQAYLAAAR